MTPTVHVISIGAPDESIVDTLADVLAATFAVNAVVDNRRINPAPMYDVKRDQYSSRLMLQSLLEVVPSPDRVLGVTDVDLFMPILTFVFGEAQLGGRAAVISLYRLHQSYYGLPESIPLLYDRAVKEALHELGHTYGLIHCPDYRCVMTASRVVDEIDVKDAAFCHDCRAKIGLEKNRSAS